MIRYFMIGAAACVLIGCSGNEPAIEGAAETLSAQTAQIATADKTATLSDILASQPEDVKLRFGARNPEKTLEFFDLQPGMSVIEVLPGGGWYTKILSPYLGEDGHLIGVDYSINMWPEFGGFATPEFIEARKNWTQSWTQDMASSLPNGSSQLSAHTLSTLLKSLMARLIGRC